MTLNVTVTPEDIRLGRRECCWACPIARAANRAGASKGLINASVGKQVMRFTGSDILPLPTSAIRWIASYDEHGEVGPISFQLDVIEKQTGAIP